LHVGTRSRSCLSSGGALVVTDSPGGVAPLTPLTKGRCTVAPLSPDPLANGFPVATPGAPNSSLPRARRRGWIALAWVVVWGSAYAVMAIQARAPQLLAWLRQLKG